MPQPITQAWELTIPIPWWILDFFHIERGLLITLETRISAHWEDEKDNSFFIEIYFQRIVTGTQIPQTIKNSSIVLRYLWPNAYYQIPETETAWAPSRVSLELGELPTGFSLPAPSPSPPEELREVPQPPPKLPKLPGNPGTIKFNRRVADLRQRIEAQNQRTRELGPTAEQWLDTVLTRIQSGINLDKPAFAEGNITFRQLRNIDQNENPQFYLESSQHMDDNYEPPRHEESDSQDEDEEEGEEETPLPIPDQTRINLLIPSLEQGSSEPSSSSTRDLLERHLGTTIDMLIEETFRERSQTPESQ